MPRNIFYQNQVQLSTPGYTQVHQEKAFRARPTPDVPELRIVPAAALVLHEDVDPRRVEPLIQRLQHDGLLRNPPVVAPIEAPAGRDGCRYVVLDGANRTTALWKLRAPHHLVQVVDYEEVELDTWGHLVTDISQQAFTQSLTGARLDLHLTSAPDAHKQLAHCEIAASITNVNGDVFAVRGRASETDTLHRLTSVYTGRSTIHRVTTENLTDLLSFHDQVAALVAFPRYTRAEILHLASNGHKLPSGITRHVIHGRALRVNLPLSVLMDAGDTTQQKNEWLRAWISRKLTQREIRYYQEATFLFDE